MPPVRLSQGPVNYTDTGHGAPVVLVHGLLVNGTLWAELVPLLAQDLRVVVPDLPLGAHREAMNPDADLSPAGLAELVADFLAALDLTVTTRSFGPPRRSVLPMTSQAPGWSGYPVPRPLLRWTHPSAWPSWSSISSAAPTT